MALQRCLVSIATVFLLLACVPVPAAEQGQVRLTGLPGKAYVYVDGKPVTPREGILRLSPGWHEIQVELPEESRVTAVRRLVEVSAGQTRTLPVLLRPVAVVGKTIYPSGAPGPPGPPGPPGRPADPAALAKDAQTLSGLVREALALQLDDLEGRAARIQNRLFHVVPTFYWYDPGNRPVEGVPGPSGRVGPPGTPGLPGDVLLLEDEAGKPLLDGVTKQLGLVQMAEALDGLETRATRVRGTAWDSWRLKVLTPELQERLESQRKSRQELEDLDARRRSSHGIHVAAFALFRGIPGAQGPPGSRGPRGPDGRVPAGTPAVRLPAPQVRQVMALVTEDEQLQERIRRLHLQVEDLALWVAEAEQRSKPKLGASVPQTRSGQLPETQVVY